MSRYVWGIDVAVSRLAFGFADLDSDRVDVQTLITATDARDGERLGQLSGQLAIYARQTAVDYPPYAMFVEQASGRWNNPQLVYTVGVVQAALWQHAGKWPVWTIASSAWKKRVGLPGNATKPQIAAWVADRGYVFQSQDEADAVACACAGRLMVSEGRWEAAA